MREDLDLRDLEADLDLRDLEADLRDFLADDFLLVKVFLAERAALEAALAAVRAFLADRTALERDLVPALVLRTAFLALVALRLALVAFLEADLAAARALETERDLRAEVFWHTFPLLLLEEPFLQGLQGLARGDLRRDLDLTFLATATFFPDFLDLRKDTEYLVTLPLR